MNQEEFIKWAKKRKKKIPESELFLWHLDVVRKNQKKESQKKKSSAKDLINKSPWSWTIREIHNATGLGYPAIRKLDVYKYYVGEFLAKYRIIAAHRSFSDEKIIKLVFGGRVMDKEFLLYGSEEGIHQRVFMELLMERNGKMWYEFLARLAVLQEKENKRYTVDEVNEVRLPLKRGGQPGEFEPWNIESWMLHIGKGLGKASGYKNVSFKMDGNDVRTWKPLLPYLRDFDFFKNWKEVYSNPKG